MEKVIRSLQKSDPNYKVIGFINTSRDSQPEFAFDLPQEFHMFELAETVQEQFISEIVIATPASEGMTVDLYNQLIQLLESGVPIRAYTQVYEDITHRVPVQHVDKDFYRYFPFSRSNQNKLYLFFHRILDLLFSVIGLLFGILISPFIIIGNLFGNRGPFSTRR